MIVPGIVPRNEAAQEPSGSGFCGLIWLFLNVTIRNPPYGTSSSIEFEAHNYFLGDLFRVAHLCGASKKMNEESSSLPPPLPSSLPFLLPFSSSPPFSSVLSCLSPSFRLPPHSHYLVCLWGGAHVPQ